MNKEESARVFAAFGPVVLSPDELARRLRNDDVGLTGMRLVRSFDIVDRLARITCPTLVCVGDLDPVTPVAAAREILDALPPGLGRLEVLTGAGHFSWLDQPDAYWSAVTGFLARHPRSR